MASRTRTKPRTIADGPLRAVAYVRLSKAKPKPGDTEVGLETQQAGCERAIVALGGSVIAVEQDIHSGDRLDRPGLWRAIERVQAGDANAVIVYAVDRFGRDSVQQGVAVHAIRAAGGRLLSATQDLEQGPIGELMRNIYEFAGAIELASVRERTNRALDAKFRKAARYKPSTRPPYGYRRIGSGATATYEIEPTEAAVVRRVFTERAAGTSLRRILLGLNADGIPGPAGGHWFPSTLRVIVGRETYATGQHECWRTRIERDADNVPFVVERPEEDRYNVAMPAIIDPALFARGQVAAERNVWSSRRADRPAEYGLLRYGFGRCATCGRALSVVGVKDGTTRYACTHHQKTPPCPAPASIKVDALDGPILTWLQGIIEDPTRADAYRVERRNTTPDARALAAALAAERHVAELEQQATALAKNLALVSGAAAQIVAEQLNSLNDDIDAARTGRDWLVEACRVTVAEDALTLAPQDALAQTILEAIHAMAAADPEPTQTFTVLLRLPEGAAEFTVPLSWKAWQAALAVLNVTVAVAQERSELPRWAAEMRLPGGVAVSGSSKNGYLFASRA
ncbi:MAG: Resolvase domain protein [Burkholderiales bacterium]|jgi:site-specific DNA recombinase|nr:Resolvase domain protein [Burkholderiales bacterium]